VKASQDWQRNLTEPRNIISQGVLKKLGCPNFNDFLIKSKIGKLFEELL
jgi:hypothetical protein